jgi:hypothetical protein
MSEQPGLIERTIGRIVDFVGDRWWLSFSIAALSMSYPIYYFGFQSLDAYSRRDTKIAAALAIFALAMAALGWLSFTSRPSQTAKSEEN